jgi:hypothetical protein
MTTTVDDIIQEANAAFQEAKDLADQALTEVGNTNVTVAAALGGIVRDYSGAKPTPADVIPGAIAKPMLPTSDFSVDVRDAFDHAFGSFNADLKPQIIDYLAEFFPDIAGAVRSGSDQWIIDTITSGGYVPVAVENAIWNRARDKEMQDAGRAEQSIIDATAARGFSMPTGATAAALLSLQQESVTRMAAVARDIAVNSFTVANENIKFAIQQAIGLRTAFVGALGEFIKTAMIQPNGAAEYAKTILAAKSNLYDAATRLYSATVAEEQMRVEALQKNVSLDLTALATWYQAKGTELQVTLGGGRAIVDAQVAKAEMLARMSGAAMATRNTMLSASGSSS